MTPNGTDDQRFRLAAPPSLREEMEAYDSLSPEIRRAVAYAPLDLVVCKTLSSGLRPEQFLIDVPKIWAKLGAEPLRP